MSEPYREDNLLDRLTEADTLQVHYDQEMRRERELLARRLALAPATCSRSAAARTPAATSSRGPASA